MGLEQQRQKINKNLEDKALRITSWVGSTESIIIHTIIFGFFILMMVLGANVDTIMLILTTLVSLEAIYLAIFIQMSVNRQAQKLEDVSVDIEEIQEDIDEIQEDVDEIQVDIDEIQEDVEGIEEDIDEIQGDIDEIQEDEKTKPIKAPKAKELKDNTNGELIELVRTLNKEILSLKQEVKSLQKPTTLSKTEILKQKVSKLLKK